MARQAKFPELQKKFEDAASLVLRKGPPDKRMSGPEIVNRIAAMADEFKIEPQHIEDLRRNFSAYVQRAIAHGVLFSNGKKQGYSLAPDEPAPGQTTTIPQVKSSKPQMQWEGLLHFPATVALSIELGKEYGEFAHVVSLPKVTDQKQWGNPDIIAVRYSAWASALLYESDDLVKLLAKAGHSPERVVTAIELKCFKPGVSRSAWYQAVSEAAANSNWANESILMFAFLTTEGTETEVPPDALSLARDAGVSVLELAYDPDGSSPLRLITHVRHDARPTLRLAQLTEKKAQQTGLLREIHELLSEFESGRTLTDVDGDAERMRELISRSLRNLGRQSGFRSYEEEAACPSKDYFGSQHFETESDAKTARALLISAVMMARDHFLELDPNDPLGLGAVEPALNEITVKEAGLLRPRLAALREVYGTPPRSQSQS